MRGRRRGEGAGGVLRIGLIGPVVVEVAGAPVTLPGARPTAMLAMLALADDGRTPRATLLDRFWGERPEDRAAAAFRQTLHTLRRALGPAGGRLRSGGGVVALDLGGATVDLRAEAARPLLRPAAERAALAQLAAREALAGLAVSAGEAEAWIAAVRDGWRTHATRALRANLEAALDETDWPGAWALARALERLDPWCEAAQTALMRAEAAIDGPGAAARRRDAFAARLDAELGVAPTAAFDDAARRLRREGAGIAPPGPGASGRACGATPVAALRWLDDAGGLAGLARETLARELSRLGVPVLLAEPETGAPPALYTVTGGFAAAEDGRELRIEVLAPGAGPILVARLPLRRAEDVRGFEARVAAAARDAGRRVRAHLASASTVAAAILGDPGWLSPDGLAEPSPPHGAPAAPPTEPAAGPTVAPAGVSAVVAVVVASPAEAAAVVAAEVSLAWDALDHAAPEAGAPWATLRADLAADRPPALFDDAPDVAAADRAALSDDRADTLDFAPRAAPPPGPDPDPDAATDAEPLAGLPAPAPWEPRADPARDLADPPADPGGRSDPAPDGAEASLVAADRWRFDPDHPLAA